MFTTLSALTLAALTGAQAIFVFLGVLFAAGLLGLFFPRIRRNNALFAPCIILTTIVFSGLVVGGLMWYLY
ncbi:MAG: hypothetical protein ACKVS8_05615 [Phycisphaerales bacterium]